MMPEWSREGRAQDFDRLTGERWDVLVIGGGITGVGVALDAASRGLKTALVEKNDFASGTSSKSSKLIHGGLRYLREYQFKTTFEASREKHLLRRLAPHLVEDLPFLFPVAGGFASRVMMGTGLWIYDLAAGLPKGMVHRRVDFEEVEKLLPGIPEDRINGGFLYFDARADDCRLVLHVAKKAVMHGAVLLNYTEVDGFEIRGGKIRAARVRDAVSGREGEVTARSFVNATGIWCDDVRKRSNPKSRGMVRPSKGVHLIVSRSRIRNECAAVLASADDRRVVFLIPWGEFTVIGTTDTFYKGDINSPTAENEDIAYLLQLVNDWLPDVNLTRADIISTYAGLRPLLEDESEHASRASRDHEIRRGRNGLLTVTGGKLTTYRLMARQVVDKVIRKLGQKEMRSTTHKIDLFAEEKTADPLITAYGSEAPAVARLGEAAYVLKHERAVHVSDILARRTRTILFSEDQGRNEAERLARSLAATTGWDAEEEIDRYQKELELHPRFE